MSEYDDQIDDNDSICPYCEERYQVECEDYSEDDQIIECHQCGKKYHLCQSFTVNHCTSPDCELNGEEHQFERVECTNGPADFCKTCGKCRLIKKPEGVNAKT